MSQTTKIWLFFLGHPTWGWGVSAGWGQRWRQPAKAVLGLRVQPQAWTKNTDTNSSPACRQKPSSARKPGPFAPPGTRPIAHPGGLGGCPPRPFPPRGWSFKSPAPDSLPPSALRDCARTRPGPGVRRPGGCVVSGRFSRNPRAPCPRPGWAGMGCVTSARWRDVPDTCTLAWGGLRRVPPSAAWTESLPVTLY